MSAVSKERRNPDHRHDLPTSLATCAATVGKHLRGELSEASMRQAVATFASEVNAVGIPPERALAQLKQAILHVPEMSARPAMERGELLRILVQDAIAGYYGRTDTRSSH